MPYLWLAGLVYLGTGDHFWLALTWSAGWPAAIWIIALIRPVVTAMLRLVTLFIQGANEPMAFEMLAPCLYVERHALCRGQKCRAM